MHQTRKGKPWHFGMKAHLGVDRDSKLVPTLVATAANVADITKTAELLAGEETWLKLPERFQQAGNHFEWRVENDHREWLLQIINDVRVGSWVELGSPDDLDAAEQQVGEESARHLALMELAGMFQSVLLMGTED